MNISCTIIGNVCAGDGYAIQVEEPYRKGLQGLEGFSHILVVWYAWPMKKIPIVISACLLGRQCRYDGSSVPFPQAVMLEERYTLIGVCPEVLGGLQTPRSPSELLDGRVISREGDDCTEAFLRGAQRALEIAEASGCKRALLMDRSPSCGYGVVYDGTFSGILIPGKGIFASLLESKGFMINSSSHPEALLG